MPAVARVAVLVLVVIAVMVAYPWTAAVAAVALLVAVLAVRRHTRPRRTVQAARRPVRRPTLDERVALRRAYQDLNSIERAAGLPPTPKRL